MIAAFDIETMPNVDMIDKMPTPEIKYGNTKDPAKRAVMDEAAKCKQIDKMGLDPLTARVICYAAVGMIGGEVKEHSDIMCELTDEAEIAVLQSIFAMLGADDARIITWNGINFDLPMVYKRAMILGVDPGNFGAPPLTAWTKRYSTDRHYDLMQIWGDWKSSEFTKLETVSRIMLGAGKDEIDFADFPELMKTEEGRACIDSYCVTDTRRTWELFEKFNGYLFI